MALTGTAPPRFDRSPHLVELVAEVERLAAAVAAPAGAERRDTVVAGRRHDAVVASLQLDGSPVAAAPDPHVLAAARERVERMGSDPATPRRGTWFDAMRAFDEVDVDDPEAAAHDDQLHALEYAGADAAFGADDLITSLRSAPGDALAELHRHLTDGLVAPDRAGAPRVSEQAVHDAAVGRILYFTVDPVAVPRELGLLGAWLASAAAREHALVVSGVVHLELLRIHPYDAANGRLARAAARLLLRDGGLDPDGLAAPEPALDRDRLGYHDEVARTLRRRDLTIWLERWGEAVSDGLRASARALGVATSAVPDATAAYLDGLGADARFTVADHRAATGAAPADAAAALRAALDAGQIVREPGTRGLRFVTTPA
ncbi:Fic family protein [Nitriliruptoraceae bacterium ZYF776]|nr:Fic family protein [Profundirhabdus halotolerans]